MKTVGKPPLGRRLAKLNREMKAEEKYTQTLNALDLVGGHISEILKLLKDVPWADSLSEIAKDLDVAVASRAEKVKRGKK